MLKLRQAVLVTLLVVIGFIGGQYTAHLGMTSEGVSLEALREAIDSGDWITRSQVMSSYFAHLGPENLAEALEVIEARRRWLSQDELRLFMVAWARFDAPGAFSRALTWPDHTRNKGAAAAIYGWTLQDPVAVQRALEGVGDSTLKSLLVDRMVAAWAHGEDRKGITVYISQLPNQPSRDRLTHVLIREILAEGPEAVMAWAEAIPEDAPLGFKALAFEKAAGVLSQADSGIAVQFVERNLDSPMVQGAYAPVARQWVKKDSTSAMEWASGLPAGKGRDRAVRIAFREWQEASPIAAERWLVSADGGRALDPARLVFARQWAATSPLEAAEFSQEITDPVLREESLVSTLIYWLEVDREAASTWLAESTLPNEARKRIEQAGRPAPKRKRGPGGPAKNQVSSD